MNRARASARQRRQPLPVLALVGAACAALFFVLPLLGLIWRAPWRGFGAALATPEVATALRLSLLCSLAATALSMIFGLPLAWVQARLVFRGRALLRALTLLPIVLPPVVGGVALLTAFGRRGLLGQWLDAAFGLRLPFSTPGAILAEAFVAMPFFVLAMEGAFAGSDRRLEDAARTLGAGPWRVFWNVTPPLVRPSLLAGAVLCWARALVSSARPSPSPATSRAVHRQSRSPSTCCSRVSRRPASRSAWCWSSCRSASWSSCAIAG
jgi:molybdate transport system permease protein